MVGRPGESEDESPRAFNGLDGKFPSKPNREGFLSKQGIKSAQQGLLPPGILAAHAEAEDRRAAEHLPGPQFGRGKIRIVRAVREMLRLQRHGVGLAVEAAIAGELARERIARIDLDPGLGGQALQGPTARGVVDGRRFCSASSYCHSRAPREAAGRRRGCASRSYAGCGSRTACRRRARAALTGCRSGAPPRTVRAWGSRARCRRDGPAGPVPGSA